MIDTGIYEYMSAFEAIRVFGYMLLIDPWMGLASHTEVILFGPNLNELCPCTRATYCLIDTESGKSLQTCTSRQSLIQYTQRPVLLCLDSKR